MNHEFFLFLLLLAAACLAFSAACWAAQAVYSALAYRIVRILRDRWLAYISYALHSGKTVNVLSSSPDDFLNACGHVWWLRHYGRAALLFRSWVRPSFRAAFWVLLAAMTFCF